MISGIISATAEDLRIKQFANELRAMHPECSDSEIKAMLEKYRLLRQKADNVREKYPALSEVHFRDTLKACRFKTSPEFLEEFFSSSTLKMERVFFERLDGARDRIKRSESFAKNLLGEAPSQPVMHHVWGLILTTDREQEGLMAAHFPPASSFSSRNSYALRKLAMRTYLESSAHKDALEMLERSQGELVEFLSMRCEIQYLNVFQLIVLRASPEEFVRLIDLLSHLPSYAFLKSRGLFNRFSGLGALFYYKNGNALCSGNLIHRMIDKIPQLVLWEMLQDVEQMTYLNPQCDLALATDHLNSRHLCYLLDAVRKVPAVDRQGLAVKLHFGSEQLQKILRHLLSYHDCDTIVKFFEVLGWEIIRNIQDRNDLQALITRIVSSALPCPRWVYNQYKLYTETETSANYFMRSLEHREAAMHLHAITSTPSIYIVRVLSSSWLVAARQMSHHAFNRLLHKLLKDEVSTHYVLKNPPGFLVFLAELSKYQSEQNCLLFFLLFNTAELATLLKESFDFLKRDPKMTHTLKLLQTLYSRIKQDKSSDAKIIAVKKCFIQEASSLLNSVSIRSSSTRSMLTCLPGLKNKKQSEKILAPAEVKVSAVSTTAIKKVRALPSQHYKGSSNARYRR